MSTDVVVIGSGIAGCAAALSAARQGVEVALLAKSPDPEETNTRYAQGGIVYSGPDDSPELLVEDILTAGAGAGSKEMAKILAHEGPPLVRRLLIEELAVPFDRVETGFEGFHLTREAAHSVSRTLHHEDTSGKEIQRALTRAVFEERRVTLLPGAEVLQFVAWRGRCVGVHAVRGSSIEAYLSPAVILATGGLGALYEYTTNPPGATGDGVGLAMEAGVQVRDLHYVQFHPTALYVPGAERFLISESVRGEGGVLHDPDGEEFIRHTLGSLAPRDVVAREIWAMMERTGSPCAYLDIASRPQRWLKERFPTIYARCQEAGIDMSREPIPVVPAAHYLCGGVGADDRGRTSLAGLWAAGEVAGTGLHGANRLASTSLLEGLVWGWRAGEDAVSHQANIDLPSKVGVPQLGIEPEEDLARAWARLRRVMWERAGLVRSEEGLRGGLEEMNALQRKIEGDGHLGALRLRRALLVARGVLEHALSHSRSRGCHYRADLE